MLTFYKNRLVSLLRGLLYHLVLYKSQGLNRDLILTVGSDLSTIVVVTLLLGKPLLQPPFYL